MSFSPDSYLTPPLTRWSTRWYHQLATDPRWLGALEASLLIAVCTSVLSVLVATPAALTMRQWPAAPRRGLTLFVLLPALLPPTAMGCGLLPLFQRIGLWGTYHGLVLAHAILALPIAFLILQSAVDERLAHLEAIAAGLGASPRQVFWKITGPLLRPALVTAAIVAFVLSLNESLVSLFLTTADNETLPALIWPQLRYAPTPVVAVASAVTTGLSLAALPFLVRRIVTR